MRRSPTEESRENAGPGAFYRPAPYLRLLRRLGWLHRIGAKTIAERLRIDLLQFNLARQNLLLPFLMRRFGGVKFGHHLFREQFQAFANMLMRVAAGLV